VKSLLAKEKFVIPATIAMILLGGAIAYWSQASSLGGYWASNGEYPVRNFAALYAILPLLIGMIQPNRWRAVVFGATSLLVSVGVFYATPALTDSYMWQEFFWGRWQWFALAILLGYIFGVGGYNLSHHGKKLAMLLLGVMQFAEIIFIAIRLPDFDLMSQPLHVWIYFVIQFAVGAVLIVFTLKNPLHLPVRHNENKGLRIAWLIGGAVLLSMIAAGLFHDYSSMRQRNYYIEEQGTV